MTLVPPASPPEPTRAAPRSGRRAAVLTLAAVTMAVEVASLADLIPGIVIGRFRISPSVIPALVLAVVCGDRLLGRSRGRHAATAFWVLTTAAFVTAVFAYLRVDRPLDVPALVLAAFTEEMVYRLAIPAAVALGLRTGLVPDVPARITAFVVAGVWFAFLPGHRAQIGTPAEAVPFLAFALLSALLVYRSGSVLPMALVHASSNLLTLLMWNDGVDQDARSAVLGCLLVLLVVAYGRTRWLVHGDDGRIIDIRTGRPAATARN